MTVKEKILKIMALAISIEPTATRYVTAEYSSYSDRVSIYVFAKDQSGILTEIDYSGRHDLPDNYNVLMDMLSALKNDMDAERQGEA